METVISKHEARHIMRSIGRSEEYDALVHRLLPQCVEAWVSQGLAVSIEHCFIRRQGACSLKIECVSPQGRESHAVLLNGEAALFPIFSRGQLVTVVTSKRLEKVLSAIVHASAMRLHQRHGACNDATGGAPQNSAVA